MKRLLAVVLVLGTLALSCTGRPPVSPSSRSATAEANLLSPAPRPAAHTLAGECNVGIIRASHVDPAELLDVLRPYLPTWLPNGFGLLFGFRGSGLGIEDGNGAIWTDAGCRQVHLEFLPHVAHEESPRPPGQWALISDNNCTFSPLVDVPCFAYHAQDNGGVLNLLTVGLGQRGAARIVAGIPLDD